MYFEEIFDPPQLAGHGYDDDDRECIVHQPKLVALGGEGSRRYRAQEASLAPEGVLKEVFPPDDMCQGPDRVAKNENV